MSTKEGLRTIKDLRMPVFKELTDILNVENSVDFGWKSLMARFDFYKAKHISSFSRCTDPADALLLDLKNRMITVDELYRQFEKMGHKEAMDVIKQQVSPSVLMSQTTQDMIKPQQENPCYLDNSLPLEPGGVIRISQEQPLLLPSAPPPPSTALLECEADLSMSKMNMEWARKETGDFKQCCIGGSCYGLSFRVTPPGGGSKVVIKKLSSEVDIAGLPRLCRLNHTNLAKVFGYLSPHDQSCHFCLIREFVCGHPLDHLLKHIDAMKVPESTYAWPSWQSRLLLAKGVASGLDYLHSNGCYHGHLTSCNVIVGDGGVKMTDYALTNSLGKTHTTEFSRRETEAFTAPEVMRTGAVSSYGDVYAYGNILLELLTGKMNYDPKRQGPQDLYSCLEVLIEDDHPDKAEVVKVSCKKADWPEETAFDLFSFARLCLNPAANSRPGMNEMVDQLDALM